MGKSETNLQSIGYVNKFKVNCGFRFETEKDKNGYPKVIIIDTKSNIVEKGSYPNGFGGNLTFDEIVACAKFIEENNLRGNKTDEY